MHLITASAFKSTKTQNYTESPPNLTKSNPSIASLIFHLICPILKKCLQSKIRMKEGLFLKKKALI